MFRVTPDFYTAFVMTENVAPPVQPDGITAIQAVEQRRYIYVPPSRFEIARVLAWRVAVRWCKKALLGGLIVAVSIGITAGIHGLFPAEASGAAPKSNANQHAIAALKKEQTRLEAWQKRLVEREKKLTEREAKLAEREADPNLRPVIVTKRELSPEEKQQLEAVATAAKEREAAANAEPKPVIHENQAWIDEVRAAKQKRKQEAKELQNAKQQQ
jgi:hypothetical protein